MSDEPEPSTLMKIVAVVLMAAILLGYVIPMAVGLSVRLWEWAV